MRIDQRDDCEHLRFPKFVGTLPTKMGAETVRMILPPLLLSYAPISTKAKIDCGKSMRSGQPKIERDSNRVICRFGRMILIAELVEDLAVEENDDGSDTLRWNQLRRVRYDKETGDEIEVTHERRASMTTERRTGVIA